MTVICLPLIAQLPAPDSAGAVGWLLLGLAALAVSAEKIMVFVDRAKGTGVNANDLATFATKPELESVDRRFTSEIVGQTHRIEAWEKTNSKELQSINRALGRIEGALNNSNRGN